MSKLLTVEQAAERLNLKLNTVRIKIRNGELPYFFKLGRDWRVDEADLEKYIEELKEQSQKK